MRLRPPLAAAYRLRPSRQVNAAHKTVPSSSSLESLKNTSFFLRKKKIKTESQENHRTTRQKSTKHFLLPHRWSFLNPNIQKTVSPTLHFDSALLCVRSFCCWDSCIYGPQLHRDDFLSAISGASLTDSLPTSCCRGWWVAGRQTHGSPSHQPLVNFFPSSF